LKDVINDGCTSSP